MKIKHFMMMTMAAVALVFGVSSCGCYTGGRFLYRYRSPYC